MSQQRHASHRYLRALSTSSHKTHKRSPVDHVRAADMWDRFEAARVDEAAAPCSRSASPLGAVPEALHALASWDDQPGAADAW
jgi:hypothetical protein